MYIYKISNTINNKVYIGQTSKTPEIRFERHKNDMKRLDTHFARAMKKYGKENFYIETIDTAETQEELNLKEQYWIKYYDSVRNGYNETDAIYKCGGNTYQSKTGEEMDVIKEKIRQTKIGKKNPMARKIKAINIETGEEYFYDTVISCVRELFGSETKKGSIFCRLTGKVKSLYLGKWRFEYCDE